MTVAFVYDSRPRDKDPRIASYRAVYDSHVDPIIHHMDDAVKTDVPVEGAVNVHMFHHMPNRSGVFMSHGIGDKNWRVPARLSGFSHICVSGPAWRDKYLAWGVHDSRIVTIGYPKLDPLFARGVGSGGGVVWAPTHAGGRGSYPSSFPAADQIIARLPFPVELQPHPRNRQVKKVSDLADADVVIADCGSTVYEAWALGKPVVFPSWLVASKVANRWPGSFEHRIFQERIGRHADDEATLVRQVERALDEGITDAEVAFMEGILPAELRGASGELAASVLPTLPLPAPIELPAVFRCQKYPRLVVNSPYGPFRFKDGRLTVRSQRMAQWLATRWLPVELEGAT